jgi:ABC-type iron transport system FetAB ATPase subunit
VRWPDHRGRARPRRPHADRRAPDGEQIAAADLRFAYREGRDVLHGIDLALVPGERLAVVGPSGAGKSTLGRLLAGVHPPRAGSVTVGGVPLVDLPLEDLRGHVALVTQEQHVFVGTVADNLRWPPRRPSRARARARGGRRPDWVGALPRAWTPWSAPAAPLTPAQAQQLALARLVLADPHTLVLDEATSLLDPRAARTWSVRCPRPGRAHRRRASRTGCTPRTTRTASPSSRTADHRDRHARRPRRPGRFLRRPVALLADDPAPRPSWAADEVRRRVTIGGARRSRRR